jgi:hypothetical protein
VNANEHPTIEQIADLQEDLLPAAEAAALRAHLAGCEDCQSASEALAQVTDVLAAEGRDVPEIPADVAASIQAALAETRGDLYGSGSPRADTGSHESRDELARRRSRRQKHRWVLGLAAAAAAVVALGSVTDVMNGSGGDDGGAASSAEGGAADEEFAEGGGDAGRSGDAGEPTPGEAAPGWADARQAPADVRASAKDLFSSGGSPQALLEGECAIAARDLPDNLTVTTYRVDGEQALLVVDRVQGSFRVLDCETGLPIYRGKL